MIHPKVKSRDRLEVTWPLTWSIMKINFYLEELISRTILKMKILNKPSASTIFYGFKIFWADDSTLKIVKFRFFKSETSWSSGWTNFKSLEVLNFDAFKIDTFQKSDRYHSKSVVNRSELVLKTSRFKILLRYVSLKKWWILKVYRILVYRSMFVYT